MFQSRANTIILFFSSVFFSPHSKIFSSLKVHSHNQGWRSTADAGNNFLDGPSGKTKFSGLLSPRLSLSLSLSFFLHFCLSLFRSFSKKFSINFNSQCQWWHHRVDTYASRSLNIKANSKTSSLFSPSLSIFFFLSLSFYFNDFFLIFFY